MIRFLIYEDMPRSTAKLLREAGFECLDVRDIGLRGAKDDAIYQRTQEENCILITGLCGVTSSIVNFYSVAILNFYFSWSIVFKPKPTFLVVKRKAQRDRPEAHSQDLNTHLSWNWLRQIHKKENPISCPEMTS